jgi:hypothetical protein
MIEMRQPFLLVLVSFVAPGVAHADVTPPGKAGAEKPPAMMEYSKSQVDGKITASPADVLDRPYRFVVGGRAVTVGFERDFQIHVRAAGGGDLALEPSGQGYMSRTGGNVSADLVDKGLPVPLLRVASRPEACSDYWEVYVSVVDGVPRKALELYGLADPPSMSTPSVKFSGSDGAVVTTRTAEDEDGKKVRVERKRYRFDGRVYVDVSKRASAHSK